jgi:hypothetical protein
MTELAKRLSWYVTMTNPKIPAAAALTHRRMVAGRAQGCSGPLGLPGSSDGFIELRTGRPRVSQRCRPDSACIGAFVPKVFN